MAEVILMPRLSDTMTEGVIAAWHKKVGDKVKKGELLAEVETDKATMDLESYKDGTLLHIGSEKGGKLQVNDLLAIIGAPGEDITNLIKENQGGQATGGNGKSTDQKSEQKKEEKKPEAKQQESKQEVKTETSKSPSKDFSKMDEVVLMPRLSDTMTEGVIADWHKKVGDTVKKGEVLADIETDKATMELESYKNGKLLYVGAKKGEKIQVNDLLAIIGEEGKVNVDEIVKGLQSGGAETPKEKQTESSDKKQQKEQPAEAGSGESETNGRVKASPLAKKLAKEKGIDLSLVDGSGDGGRIVKADIDSYQPAKGEQRSAQRAETATVTAPQIRGEEGYADTPNSQMRKTIAKRLGESKFTAPHFYLTAELNMDNVIAARTQMNEYSPVKISFQDILIKACAMALRQHPAVNSSWMGDHIRTWKHIHIGSAVAVPEGLIVPVIKFADEKSFSQIAKEAKELYEKARNKKLQPQEYSGNTFTISNLGMMDIDEFTAIINPPDSCILAVGRIKEVVVRKNNEFTVINVMKVTMSCDHRSVDGAVGAAFLQTLRRFMEQPLSMLV